jgi:hypothetical protein
MLGECHWLDKEYRVIVEVGMTNVLEVKHSKILRMVHAGSLVVQLMPPKTDPTTGMLRAWVRDVEGVGWITIKNNKEKLFLEGTFRNPCARGTPEGPEAAGQP